MVGGARGCGARAGRVRVVTLNANGIRAAAAKGFFDWLARQRADVVCLQELRAQPQDLPAPLREARGWHAHFSLGAHKGYAGVALLSRRAPEAVREGFGSAEFDREGRYLEARFGPLSIASVYVPSGSSGAHRQAAKFRFMGQFYRFLAELRASGREAILAGDWNIAHREIDLRNWRANQKNSGFLPEERAWLDRIFGELGYVDVFRRLNAKPEQYTWWSNRGRAWEKNVGWRIDYQIATPGVAKTALRETIYTERRFSDHAPLTIEYDWPASAAELSGS